MPRWLAVRMATLGTAITEVIVLNEGPQGFLRRLSDPLWFQAFGAVMGMDWHSSGITTSVIGALKRGLGPRAHELGIHVCGGRGKHSRKTPDELISLADRTGLDGEGLVRASRLVAKVDNTAILDGYQLYLHAFVVTDDGDWVVVQQGMNEDRRLARRYHWRSEGLASFVEEPHDAVVGIGKGRIVNLTDRRSKAARQASVDLAAGPAEDVIQTLRSLAEPRRVSLPAHHEVRASDVFLRRLHGVLATAKERGAADFEQLLLTPGVGPRTVQALALVAEVACGTPSRFDDPARFAFAHGGKDGHPHPVPLRVYDQTLDTLRRTIDQARLGHTDKLYAFRRLEQRARELERTAVGPSLDEIIDDEWEKSPHRGGKTVFGDASEAVRRGVDDSVFNPSCQSEPPSISRRKATEDPEPVQLRLFA